jgi:hypothetical protein
MPIPKIIFQTNKFYPPQYIIDSIKLHLPDWEYIFFSDDTAVSFMEKNPIKEFPNSIEIFKNIVYGPFKSDFFRYYFLYLNGGVYIDSDAMIETNIDDIVEKYNFFSVISGMTNDAIFNGFIGANAKNIIIYKSLKYIHDLGFTALNTISFPTFLTNNMFNTIKEIAYDIRYCFTLDKEYILFKEEIQGNKAYIKDENDKNLLTHYFGENKVVPSSVIIENPKIKPTEKIKIGISLDISMNYIDIFSNGIRLNTIYLAELLCHIGYDTYFIVKEKKDIIKWKNDPLYSSIFYDNRFKFVDESEVFQYNFDIVIVLGYFLSVYILETLKIMKTKLVYYNCGNSYIVDSNVLFNPNEPVFQQYYMFDIKMPLFDEIWCIPQQIKMNEHYFKIFWKCEIIEVSFIWSPFIFEKIDNIANSPIYYKKKGKNKKIAVLEPNICIQKWCLPPLLICENTYRNLKEKELLDHIYLCSMLEKNNPNFEKLICSLDTFKKKIISIEGRTNSLLFMINSADIVVSHQWELNLNYLYLDLAWWGWPVVHNANLCKDVGYYYEEFNYEMGGKVLEDVILHHDDHIDEYVVKNRAAIDRYLPTNIDVQNSYKKLIENLYKEK